MEGELGNVHAGLSPPGPSFCGYPREALSQLQRNAVLFFFLSSDII